MRSTIARGDVGATVHRRRLFQRIVGNERQRRPHHDLGDDVGPIHWGTGIAGERANNSSNPVAMINPGASTSAFSQPICRNADKRLDSRKKGPTTIENLS
jgi:hypothetical protein